MAKLLLKLVLLIAVVAIIFFAVKACASKFFGPGGSGDGDSVISVSTEKEQESIESGEVKGSSENTAESTRFDIVIREKDILLNGQNIGLDDLESALREEYQEGTPVELTDDHAIKATYDEVVNLLDKLDVDYLTKN